MNSKEIVSRYIGALEDDLQHYTMVDKDKVKAKFIEFQLEEYKTIEKDLDRLEKLEKENKYLKEINEPKKLKIFDVYQGQLDKFEKELKEWKKHNEQLEKENRELKTSYESLKKDYWELDKVENDILQKFLLQGQVISAIQDEIINKIENETIYEDVSPMCEITIRINKKIFDMLFEKKEVFESVGDSDE